ncbi:MAG: PEBP family protein [bacterium]|nr:PEBP family protein [bacterium]
MHVSATSATSGSVTIKAEAWADNWFAFYLGDTLVLEDSVPIATERSFNAEVFTFQADYPMMLNLVLKDFKENDSGLEYIGTRKQQMGDGGFIAQFTDTSTGEVVAATDTEWKCLLIHEAPLNKSCANEAKPVAGRAPCDFIALDDPGGWKALDFDDSSWKNATEYAAAQVKPKDGYDRISWDRKAKLIWGSDLETHNTILCRLKLEKP